MKITIGTRGSLLALTQTKLVASELLKLEPGLEIELKEIKTRGDKKQGTPEASKGDKKDWIFELEQEILDRKIDIAVHSGKDVPSDYEPGTSIMSVLKREDPRDVFIGRSLDDGSQLKWADLKPEAVVGTASLRRQASIRRLRPDIKLVEHRGNVPTRLAKLKELTHLSGIVLAKAGILRLNLPDLQFEEFSTGDMMPAVNQGILCIQYHSQRNEIAELLGRLSDSETQAAFVAERACVTLLKADCKSSVSVFACIKRDSGVPELSLSARVLLTDGSENIELLDARATMANAHELGERVGNELVASGAHELIAKSRQISN